MTFKGKPLSTGFVTFVDGNGRRYSANILADGTYAFRIGVPPGQYTIVVEDSPTPPMPGETRVAIPAKYQAAETSELRFNAQRGASNFNIELQ